MSVTEAVLASVVERRPLDDRESSSRDFTLQALRRLERPYDRYADPTHVTGSALVIGPRGVLLHRHKKLGIWLQPGGHVDIGESPWEAARREAGEETGLAFAPWQDVPRLIHMDVHSGGGGHIHLDLRYLLAALGDDEPSPGPGESPEVRWFSWDDAMLVADPGLKALIHATRPWEGEAASGEPGRSILAGEAAAGEPPG
ncbi:MAG: NUDIX domain-containing protein [Actinomycetota bacterium]|nr:NUDIX domain-containing protein [Actinomycetota bacterium]